MNPPPRLPLVRQYFPDLPETTLDRLARFADLFREWNSRLNLVSRRDVDHFEEHHLLHSLALASCTTLPPRSRGLDLGTGGGLPGIPLAIFFPQTRFHLCDSIGKKADAVREMVAALGLRNATVIHKRAEDLESRWDFILGRAVASLPTFLAWVQGKIRAGGAPDLPHGVIYWKGTRYEEELASLQIKPFKVHPIHGLLPRPYFEGKFLLHLAAHDLPRLGVVPCR